MMDSKRYVLLPAYQPTALLPSLARELRLAGFTVVVVDDGSGPDYAVVFDAARPYATVLSYPENRGKGHALKHGLRWIGNTAASFDVVVTMDADGQHTVADAQRLARAAQDAPLSLVLGVRTFDAKTPLRSRMGNKISSLAYRAASGISLTDTQTGLRAFGTGLISFLQGVSGQRYEYEMNVLMEAARSRIPLVQVPIAAIYIDDNRGSHFHTVRDSALVFGNVLKFAGSSLTGFAIDYSLYSGLVLLLGGMGPAAVPVSNVCARVVSASANFAINKKFVFRSDAKTVRSGVQYAVLAVSILAGNTVLLSFLVNGLGADKYAAKLITELTFFGLSWLGQRYWIFRKRGGRPCAASAAQDEHRPALYAGTGREAPAEEKEHPAGEELKAV